MDYDKIREFVRQAHPKRKFVSNDPIDPSDSADGSESDVDAGNFKLSSWKKFGAPRTAARNEGEDSMTSERSDPREKFRQRTLTGGSEAGSDSPAFATSDAESHSHLRRAIRRDTGKLALERLELTPPRGRSDSPRDAQDSLDVLVDEELGIIGESDSGPEKK